MIIVVSNYNKDEYRYFYRLRWTESVTLASSTGQALTLSHQGRRDIAGVACPGGCANGRGAWDRPGLLLVGAVEVAGVVEAVQGGGGVAEYVARGGKPFAQGGVDERDVLGGDCLGLMVNVNPLVVIQFLAGPDVKFLDFGFPIGGRLSLVGMPQVQVRAAVPEIYAAVWVRFTGKPDDYGFPIIGGGQLGYQFAEGYELICSPDAGVAQPPVDYRADLLTLSARAQSPV